MGGKIRKNSALQSPFGCVWGEQRDSLVEEDSTLMQPGRASRMTDHPCPKTPGQGGQAVASSGGLLPRHFQAVLCAISLLPSPIPGQGMPHHCCHLREWCPRTSQGSASGNVQLAQLWCDCWISACHPRGRKLCKCRDHVHPVRVSLLAPCSGPGAQWLLKKQPVRPQQG